MQARNTMTGYDVMIIAATRLMLADYKRGEITLRQLRRYLLDDSLFVERFGSDMGQYILDNIDDVRLGNYNWGLGIFGGTRYE